MNDSSFHFTVSTLDNSCNVVIIIITIIFSGCGEGYRVTVTLLKSDSSGLSWYFYSTMCGRHADRWMLFNKLLILTTRFVLLTYGCEKKSLFFLEIDDNFIDSSFLYTCYVEEENFATNDFTYNWRRIVKYWRITHHLRVCLFLTSPFYGMFPRVK